MKILKDKVRKDKQHSDLFFAVNIHWFMIKKLTKQTTKSVYLILTYLTLEDIEHDFNLGSRCGFINKCGFKLCLNHEFKMKVQLMHI